MVDHKSKTKRNELKKKEVYTSSGILTRHQDRAPDDKCSIQEFTAKRKEILLLNISIQTQQEQIDNLHKDIHNKENELNKREAKLQKNEDSLKELEKLALAGVHGSKEIARIKN